MKRLDEGIFIHRISYSESSLITTFFTKDHGFQKFLFKGGKKKSHQLFPLSVSEIEYFERKESDLWNVTSVEPAFRQMLPFDPVKSSIAFFLADILNMVLRGTERDQELYSFVRDSIQELEKTNELAMFPPVFMIGLTKYLGVQPLIEDATKNWFDLRAGTIGGFREWDSLSVEGPVVVSIIALLAETRMETALQKPERQELLRVIIDYYRIHVPGFKEPGTYDIIREILY